MRRRDFLGVLGSAAAGWPLAAQSQERAIPVIGFLSSGMPDAIPRLVAAFRQGLGEAGYVEGQNVTIYFRWAEGEYNRLPDMAANMVHRKVSVIAAWGPVATRAAKVASSTIPIVFASGGDVVTSGLVASINRPGGNATGVNLFTQAVEAKKLELLVKLTPAVATVAFLINPNNPAVEGKTKEMIGAARTLGRQLHVLSASTENEIDTAFAILVQKRIGALLVNSDPFFDDNQQRHQLIELAARHTIPAIYGQRAYAAEGGLMSYGTSIADAYRQVGVYAGRILSGEKPSELPVMQPTKFELLINLKTAKALGLDMPPTLLALADEVIE